MFKKTTAFALIGVLFLGLISCQNQTQNSAGDESITEQEAIEERLILENATLNQVDSQGNTLWKLDVKRVVYRQNNQNAELEKVNGTLYEAGDVFLQIEAEQGMIVDDGKQINLEGNVIATDPRNGAVLRSEKVQWSPEENLLVIPNAIAANNERFNVSANQGKYYTDQQKLTLIGEVEGVANDPPLQLKGEQFNWLIPEDQVNSKQALQVDRYNPETETISDRVTANSGEVNLAQKMVFLKDNVQFKSIAPPLQAASNVITWNIEQKLITSDQPIQLVHTEDQMTLTGNQGKIDLDSEIADFQGGVKGVSESNQAVLFANHLRWNIPTQNMEAEGNVIYEQNNPPLTSRGEKASGILQEENIVVEGNSEQRVVTELVP